MCFDELRIELARAVRIFAEQREHPARGEESRLRLLADRRVVATPTPFAGMTCEPGPNRVEHDVAGQLEQMRVALDQLVVKAALEEVATGVVAPVEPFRIHAVQPVHATGDVWLRRLDEEVIVIRHQAIRMAYPSEEVDHLLHQLNEAEPVAGVDEDLLLAVPARNDVIRSAVSLEAWWAGHLPTVAAAGVVSCAWHQLGAKTARFRICGTCPGARHQGFG
jgi:hypothetical protein